MSQIKDSFEETVKKLKLLLDVISGKEDLRSRLNVILNPSLPQTSSKLTRSQVEYVRDALWSAEQYPEFEPLKMDALELARTMLSHEGFGVEKTIELQDALTKEIEKITSVREGEREGKKDVKEE